MHYRQKNENEILEDDYGGPDLSMFNKNLQANGQDYHVYNQFSNFAKNVWFIAYLFLGFPFKTFLHQ